MEGSGLQHRAPRDRRIMGEDGGDERTLAAIGERQRVGQVTVRVGGYAHTIGCKDGEEAHVQELAAQIENKTKLIRSMGGQFSEARMLLHVALLLADEAGDLREALQGVVG